MHEQQRRRSSQSPAMSPERKQSTTATYTQQYLRRRLSQQHQEDVELQSPRSNGSRRMERRRSSEDAGERPNKLQPQQSTANGHIRKDQPVAFVADMTVEKQSSEKYAAGKGLTKRKAGKCGFINQVETMTKKRKAPCGRSTTVAAVAAGVVTVSVAGGVAVCRMYPSSPAAASILIVVERAEEALFLLLVELRNAVGPFAKELGESMRVESLALLRNGHLTQAARAAHALANQRIRVFPGLANTSTLVAVCMELMEDTRGQLRLAVSGLTDVLKLVVDWIQPRLKALFTVMELDLDAGSELVERVRSFLLTALAFLAEALKESATWARLSVDEVFEWMGLEPDVSDAELPSDEFLAPLMAHQAAIKNVVRGFTARESRALDHVKHSEKRRVAIASATNSIIADTRVTALNCIFDAKMAAIELMEERMKQLADQYAASIEQELKEYKRTSRQVLEEGNPGELTEVVSNDQPHVDAAASLKLELALRSKTTDEMPTEVPLPEDRSTTTGRGQREPANEEQARSGVKLSHEERLLVESIEAPVSEEQGPSQDELPDNIDKETEITIELAELTAELAEMAATVHSSSEAILASEYVSDEQVEITALTEVDELIDERSEAPVVGIPTSSVHSDHATEDQTYSGAGLVEENQQNIELASLDKEEVARGEERRSVVTEVLVELEGIVLEVEHTQVEVTNLYGADNLSEADLSEQEVLFQHQEQTAAHLTVLVDGPEVELVVEVDTLAAETVEKAGMEQRRPDISTRVATLPGTEVLEEEPIETHKKQYPESVQGAEHLRVDENEALASDGAIEVHKELQDTEAVSKVDMAIKDAEVVVADLERTEAKIISLRSYDAVAAESDTQAVDFQRQESGDLEAKDGVGSAALIDIETQEMERVVVDKEIHELAQLEQVLLQEDERVRIEEELRVIAQEEEIELQTEVHSTAGQTSRTNSSLEDRTIETIDAKTTEVVDAGRGSGGWQSRLGIPFAPTLVLHSVAFLALATLAAYLLARYHKRGPRAPRRRKRWQRLADMDDSDAEEVVLLPDDSSDDEAGEDAALPEEPKLKAVELMSSGNVETTVMRSPGSEEADVEEETTEDHEDVEEETEEFAEEEGAAQSDSESVDYPSTTKSIAPADDSDTTTAPVSTPPPSASTQETPDTSQRALRRLRRERRS
ncbi:hypothetical protein PRIC1_004157 [Phytophthora ramorum]